MPRRRSRKGRRRGRMPAVNQSHFAMIPRHDVARSAFNRRFAHKTTFDASFLIPIYVDEVLPGDHFKCNMTAFTRLATPLFPIMDNLHLSSFFFFVPNRLVWDNWQKFCGEQESPGDSIDFLIPQLQSPTGGYPVNSIFDYMGLPTEGQVDPGGQVHHSSLWLRAYNLIWNEWFRDQNLQDPVPVPKDDGPDDQADYGLLRRGKRHDYFTSCLPWPQKGEAVTLGLAGQAPVSGLAVVSNQFGSQAFASDPVDTAGNVYPAPREGWSSGDAGIFIAGDDATSPQVFAELGAGTATTINALRQAFQIQRLLERDARGGTRYIELLQSHFGVAPPDMRLQRPEFLGGGSTPVVVNPVAQTSATGVTGSSTPLGELGAIGTGMVNRHGFSQAFTEHGVVIGLIAVRADLTYQQGLKRMWSRRTRYDFYWPVFSHLGEQAVLQKEIFSTGVPSEDDTVFGYQERWAEYRYLPSMVTGFFRSTVPTGTLDPWHLSQRFENAPVLDAPFIEDNPPMERVLAVGSEANGKQFLFDSFFEIRTVRPMPTYSVPGWVDHF